MFRCQSCQEVSGPGVKANVHVVQTRPMIYEHPSENGPITSKGFETVREVRVCAPCKSFLEGTMPEMRKRGR